MTGQREEFFTASGGHVVLEPVCPEHFDARVAVCMSDHEPAAEPGTVPLSDDDCLRLGSWLLRQVLHGPELGVLEALVAMVRHTHHLADPPEPSDYDPAEPF